MSRGLGLVAVLVLGSLAGVGTAEEIDLWSHELLIELRLDRLRGGELTSLAEALAGSHGLSRLDGLLGTFRLTAVNASAARRIAERLNRHPAVSRVQPNYRYRAMFVPNDPLFSQQWNFSLVKAQEAWDLDTTAPLYGGDPSIIVAVLDSGLTAGPDYGSIRLATGYDYVNNDSDPRDDNGHGTHVIGTLAQTTNNASAGAGLAFESTIMPIKVLDGAGVGSTAAIAQGVSFARQNGAKVINLSLGGNDDDPILHSAITTAKKEGVVLIGASGNDGANTISFPARYEEVIAVGAVRYDETKTTYSNSGAEIDLVAPGGDLSVDQNNDGNKDGILQQTCTTSACTSHDNYFYVGTSQAAPHVAAAAALVLAAGGAGDQVQSVLQSTAKDLGTPGTDTSYGAGLMNLTAAVTSVVKDTSPPTGSITVNGGAESTGSTSVILTLTAADTTGVQSMQFSNDGVSFSAAEPFKTEKLWDLADPATGGSTAAGSHAVSVKFIDRKGNVSSAVSDSITLDLTPPPAPQVRGYQTRARLRSLRSGQPVTISLPYFQFSAADPSGIEGYYVLWSTRAKADPAVEGDFQPANAYAPPQPASLGVRYLLVKAKDGVGNVSEATTFVFRRRVAEIVAVPASGEVSALTVYSTRDRRVTRSLTLVDAPLRSGIQLAAGDLDADGTEELVAAASRGSSRVTILRPSGAVVKRFAAYGRGFRNGLSVAVADLDGDGGQEILTAPFQGAAQVSVFDRSGRVLRRWFALPAASYRGGVSLAAADLDGDGASEVIVGTRRRRTSVLVFAADGKLQRELRPFGPAARSGLTVAVADVEADGQPEIVAATASQRCQVRLLSATGTTIDQFAGLTSPKLGCQISTGDVDSDGRDELIITSTSQQGVVRIVEADGKLWERFSLPTSGVSTTVLRH